MFESFELNWRLYNALPAHRFLMLLPWHFTALLLGLGVLAAIGIHHLIGWTFGFYSQGGLQRRIAGAITLAVLIFSVQGLLLAYMLRTQADALVKPMLSPENAVQPAGVLGSILLDPAFSDTDLEHETHVAKARLAATVIGTEDDDYRAGLEGFIVSPDRLVMASASPNPAPDATGGADAPKPPDASADTTGDETPAFTNRDDLISAIAVQIGLRWIMDPEQTWPEAMPAGTSGAPDPRLRIPEFVLALVDEIQDNAVLDRLDWEHVAGTRFVQAVLQPILVERVARSAGLLAVSIVALDLAYFAIAARIFGRLRRRARAQDAESDGK